jgi:hypothetical protein
MLIIEFCHDCGVRQPLTWLASDELWKEVTGYREGEGVYCPRCFQRRARQCGIFLRWVPMVEFRRRDGAWKPVEMHETGVR